MTFKIKTVPDGKILYYSAKKMGCPDVVWQTEYPTVASLPSVIDDTHLTVLYDKEEGIKLAYLNENREKIAEVIEYA